MRSNGRFPLLSLPDGLHWPRQAIARWLCYSSLAILVMAMQPREAAAADRVLLLDVQVNGHSIGKIGEFTMRGTELMATCSELTDLGFRVPAFQSNASASTFAKSDDLIRLSQLSGLA